MVWLDQGVRITKRLVSFGEGRVGLRLWLGLGLGVGMDLV